MRIPVIVSFARGLGDFRLQAWCLRAAVVTQVAVVRDPDSGWSRSCCRNLVSSSIFLAEDDGESESSQV